MFLVGLFGFFFVMVVRASGQIKTNEIAPRSTSPFEIARVINLSKGQWDKRRIELVVDLDTTWEKLGIHIENFGACGGDCRVEIFKNELDGKPGREVIVKLTRSWNDCRYLVFTRNNGHSRRWKLLGYIDHDFNRYQMASHRIIRAFGRNWFVLRGQEGSGSGYALYSETWYQVNDKGVRPVLNYPVEGNTYPWPTGLGRIFKAHVVNMRHSEGRNNEIHVRYTVTYTILDYFKNEFTKLFVNHHGTCYVWKNKNQMFLFDARRSGVTENEIDTIAGIETEDEPPPVKKIGSATFYSKAFVGGGYEVFLKYNFQNLMRIATGRDEGKKRWLKQFLNDCENTTEKGALLQVLTK